MLPYGQIVFTNLNAESALSRSRAHHRRIQSRAHGFRQTETVQSGVGKDDGIVLARLEFPETRVNIAAQRLNVKIRTQRSKLGGAAKAAGADASLFWQRANRIKSCRDKC